MDTICCSYLSWEMMVCLMGEVSVVWRQMWHHVILIGDSNCIRQVFAEVRSKNRIANTWLSKCHNLNIVFTLIDLEKKQMETLCIH